MTGSLDPAGIPLRDDGAIPRLGLGVFQVPPRDAPEVVLQALATGYRHIDTAAAYGNEAGVGEGCRRSGVPRNELFVATKCWNDSHGREAARRACEASLERLGLDHVDLYLIHWPVPGRDRYVETWEAFIQLQAEGLARAIGVSNFSPEQLTRLIEETGVTPAVNQVEVHPGFQQPDLRRAHDELGIVTEAWSPLGQGAALREPTIAAIARAHGRTPAQVVLRWHLQVGHAAIPKSASPTRITENFDVFDFELDQSQMEAIKALDSGRRIGPDPGTFVGA